MGGLDDLDSLVTKQLAKLGLSLDAPPDLAAWQRFLARVSGHYKHVDDDRRLLTRSLELSSREMHQLQARLTDEHDRLRQIVAAISEGLSGFHQIIDRLPTSVSDDEVSQVTSTIHQAKERLSHKLTEIIAGDGETTWSREEAEHIHRAFSFVSDQLLELVQITAQRAGLQKDLEVARTVQHMLVPGRQVIERPSLRIAGFFQPAAQCGGDWWSTYDLPGDALLLVIGDVTGHGVAPAIITGVAKASCDVALHLTGQALGCADLLSMLNRSIHDAARQTLFMTCLASIYEPSSRTLTLANAGHPFPYLLRRRGQTRGLKRIIASGNPLGTAPESHYESASVVLQDEDVLVWYTDGVTESESEQGEQFGERRLRTVLQKSAGSDPAQIRDAIMSEVAAFRGSTPAPDDVTMVVACVGA